MQASGQQCCDAVTLTFIKIVYHLQLFIFQRCLQYSTVQSLFTTLLILSHIFSISIPPHSFPRQS
jgi:hypothetical protein